ncbi:hypothetical protein [Porphyromonas uenonis]|uniref:hypothetical protein n=1 Tax=Porphyromonas uenonis TaxID=281920 RepID=UPI0026F36DE6|nr:hypothetical protein [Porphyromonas uenonis]
MGESSLAAVLSQRSDEVCITGFVNEEEELLNTCMWPDVRQGTFGHAVAGYSLNQRYELNGQGLSDLNLDNGRD